jgi:putative transposase
MKAYSMDLRRRVCSAAEAGTMSRSEVAEGFGVSVSFVAKLRRRYREEGTVAARPRGGNRPPALGRRDLAALRRLVREQPDATLAELRGRLAGRRGVRVGVSTLWRALGRTRLRLPRKKSRSTRPSGTPRGCGGCAARSPAN